ncbi:MAG: DUF4340 domain-containing protein [Deltaproteobacteria bacterium]|nr:DUF4340 domain-containing protein [Deltaproteobacteria bacterium]
MEKKNHRPKVEIIMGRLKKIPRPYLYLLIVCLAAVAVFWLERPTQERRGDVLNQPLLENFDAGAVARIEIEHLLNGVQLEKKEGAWQVAPLRSQLKEKLDEQDHGPRTLRQGSGQATDNGPVSWKSADPEKIELTFSILQDVLLTSLAAANPERHGLFEVNAAGMQVRFFDAGGKKLAHLHVGKAGPAFTESYVRKEGENEVYLADRYLRSAFSIEPADWETPKESGNK